MSSSATSTSTAAPAAAPAAPAPAAAPARPFVVIELDDAPPNAKPFKNALTPPKARAGAKAPAKTLENAWLYIFTATPAPGAVYHKVGETYDGKTYNSKNRFEPWFDYNGLLQIQHYGRPLEMLVGAYLGASFKGSEWYFGATARVDALIAALEANGAFVAETPFDMTNVFPFTKAYTGKHKATVDDYLSLFRVRRRGQLYRLCTDNLEQPVRLLADPRYLCNAAGAPTAAPAAPAAPAAATSPRRALAASTADGDNDDDDDEEAADESSGSLDL